MGLLFERRVRLTRIDRDGRHYEAWQWPLQWGAPMPSLLMFGGCYLVGHAHRSLAVLVLGMSLAMSGVIFLFAGASALARLKMQRLYLLWLLRKTGKAKRGLVRVKGRVRARGRARDRRSAVVVAQRRISASLGNFAWPATRFAAVQETVDFDVVTAEGKTVHVCTGGAVLAGPPANGQHGPVLDPRFEALLTFTLAAPIQSMLVSPAVELRDGEPVEVYGVLASPSADHDELRAGAGGRLIIFPLPSRLGYQIDEARP
jgi:hypothetical protein